MTAVLVITTGGTIDKIYFDALSDYQVGDSSVDRIFLISGVKSSFTVLNLMKKDSLYLDDVDREKIAGAVKACSETSVVITHGTDTMTDTALALMGIPDKTIVLVGAMTPARFTESDAPFNLGMAYATAQIAPPGVWITMNGAIFPAGKVRKDKAAGAFVST